MALAKEVGSIRVVNTVMIGKLARMVGDDKEVWLKAVKECVPPKTVDINVKAFNAGYDL